MDTIISIKSKIKMQINLLSGTDVQEQLAQYLRQQRKLRKLSREALSKTSTVPASTIKKFELTGQISLRQLLLLWQCLDDLQRLYSLTQRQQASEPKSIDEVLAQ